MSWLYIAKKILKPFLQYVPDKVNDFYLDFRKEYPLNDRSKVILYATSGNLLEYTPRQDLEIAKGSAIREVRISLISTVRNEAGSARAWLESLLSQSRLPDEVVITDGGSSDDTVSIIREFSQTCQIPIRLIQADGANIAQGRNFAIREATHPVIAISDFGCELDQHWLENLIAPFEADDHIALSAGYYGVIESNTISKVASKIFNIGLEEVEPQNFLPSSRSVAMLKSLWESAGNYPEWLTDAGEDTLFDYHLKSQPTQWAFVPEAHVTWRAPASLLKLCKTHYRYGLGDGEAGLRSQYYWYRAIELAASSLVRGVLILLTILGFLLFGLWGWILLMPWICYEAFRFVKDNHKHAKELSMRFYPYTLVIGIIGLIQIYAFSQGVLNRPQVRASKVMFYRERLSYILASHPDRKGIVIYPPTHDWGFMFQRPHQMARAFARRGLLYFYCTDNNRTDSVFGFHRVESSLYLCHVPLEIFSEIENPVVYIGSPWNRNTLKYFHDPKIIYDHYDDLEISGGRPQDHQFLLSESSLPVVTSQILLDNVISQRPDALLLPNGVDYDWIQSSRPTPNTRIPLDWEPIAERRNPVIGYSGALAEWFDYNLLRESAEKRRDLSFVLIGVDYDGSFASSSILDLDNVFWLGMKEHSDLFQYVWRFDVGMIPFLVNNITLATSPVKLFEYMACRKPVLTTALPECKQYSDVFIAENHTQFLKLITEALKARSDQDYLDRLDAIARQSTWENRVDAILKHL